MTKIVYYVASSLDGFIAGKADDISLFAQHGSGVEKYLSDLAKYSTVIMGRRTYEFGYQFGLEPGQPAYPHMEHHIFSNTLSFENSPHGQVHVESRSIDRINEIRDNSPTDVYLCGGGVFAGWLLEHGMIDRLKIKLNPIILGEGIPIFGNSKVQAKWHLREKETFEEGLQILTYEKSLN